MLVLITGKLHVKNDAGEIVGQVLPGASFGEMACLTGHDRFVGFEAVEPGPVSVAPIVARTDRRAAGVYVKILETTIELHANRVTRATTGNVQKAEDGQPSLW